MLCFFFFNSGGAQISCARVIFLRDVGRVKVLWGEELAWVEILTRPGSARTLCEVKEGRYCRYLVVWISFNGGVDYLCREFYADYKIDRHSVKFHSASCSSRCWCVVCRAAREARGGDGHGRTILLCYVIFGKYHLALARVYDDECIIQ